MSLTDDREAFALALSNVGGVAGYAYRPPAPRAGDAWPLLGAMDRADGRAFINSWRVLVFLPQDERAASMWMDSTIDDLVDALEPLAFVDRVEPVSIGPEAAPQYALQITMRSE